jgi:hypothetical protein
MRRKPPVEVPLRGYRNRDLDDAVAATVAGMEPPLPALSLFERSGAGRRALPGSSLVACACAVLLVSALFAVCADAAQPARCGSLTGKRLVRSRSVKVVERATRSRAVVYICAPPDGRVRIAGSAFDAFAGGGEPNIAPNYSIRVLAVSGTWVAIAYKSLVDAHGSEEILKVSDARSGASYRFFEAGIPEGPGFEGTSPSEGEVERVVLNPFGQLAFALGKEGTIQIVGVRRGGARRVLDTAPKAQIPLASLMIAGHTVKWLDATVARNAVL